MRGMSSQSNGPLCQLAMGAAWVSAGAQQARWLLRACPPALQGGHSPGRRSAWQRQPRSPRQLPGSWSGSHRTCPPPAHGRSHVRQLPTPCTTAARLCWQVVIRAARVLLHVEASSREHHGQGWGREPWAVQAAHQLLVREELDRLVVGQRVDGPRRQQVVQRIGPLAHLRAHLPGPACRTAPGWCGWVQHARRPSSRLGRLAPLRGAHQCLYLGKHCICGRARRRAMCDSPAATSAARRPWGRGAPLRRARSWRL